MARLNLCWMIILVILLMFAGCSQTGHPLHPSDPVNINPSFESPLEIPVSDVNDDITSRVLLGIWSITTDSNMNCTNQNGSDKKSIEILPPRDIELHWNVASIIPPPSIVINSYDRNTHIISLDLTISNPYPVSVYDVRLIVYTDNLGHKLTNADDWTGLYDIPGGLPINPFKAYAKDQTNRVFQGLTEHTENFKIYLPDGDFNFTIAIDASYPTNCQEPYELTNFTQGIILDQTGSSTELEVTAHSWSNDVNSVKLYCPAITGTALVSFNPIDSEKWGYTLTNNTGAASGNYFGYLIATTSKSGSLALYDEVTIKITPLNSGWARTWGGVGDDHSYDVAVDENGNVYSTGDFMSSADFNPDPEVEDIHTSNGLDDIFLVKYDKYGNFQWAKTWGGSSGDVGLAIDIDSSGMVFASGDFSSTVDFGTNGIPDLRTSRGSTDCFLSKYKPDGTYIGTVTWGGGALDEVERICIGANEDILITGYFAGTSDFNPDPVLQDLHTSNGIYDVFINKLDHNGNFHWARTWGSSSDDYGNGVVSDSTGNVYCSGYFDGTCDFNPSSGTDIHSPAGWSDAFLSSFDSNGNFQWAHTWGSTYQDEAWECAVDEFDDVYVVGDFYYTVDFNPDPLETENRTAVWESDVFVSKFAPDGDFKWVLTWGSSTYDKGLTIAINSSGYLWAGGEAGECDFDPGPGTDIKSGGQYLSKFQITGDYSWSRTWSFNSYVPCLDVGSDGNSYLGGWYSYNYFVDFDPGPSEWKPDEHGEGWDCFIIKVLQNGYWE